MKARKPPYVVKVENNYVPVACGCTFRPYPHPAHKNADDPWNWEKTQKIWEKQAKKPKPVSFV